MSNIAKLKKKAAEFEARKNYEKALDIYEQVLATKHASDEDRDVALHNRVGDLHYRLGNTESALSYYEQAADLYAEGGFFNNAIALCNKILRYAPGRTIIYYKLGIISAKKGFNSDAKQNFLEYADRMQRIGKMDEAFRALKEFADLCPGQDDVRLMLSEQLVRANRKTEALEQLAILYDTLQVEGRDTESAATLDRIKALDPTYKPSRTPTPRKRQKSGLVFLDLDFDDAVPTPRGEAASPAPVADDDDGPSPHARAPQTLADRFQNVSLDDDMLEAAPSASSELTFISALTPVEPAPALDPAPPIDPVEPPESAVDTAAASEPGYADPLPQANDLPHIDLAPLVDVPDPPVEGPPSYPAEVVLEHVDDVSFAAPEPNGDGVHGNGHANPESVETIAPDDDFIDLGEWLERNRTPVSTRMVAHDEEPENEEQKDFGEMLDKFKEGISKNVDEEDFESHYDLGIAFREMGLLDEAIGSFQKALRGERQRVRAAEAIGQCFMDKGEAGVTMTVLERLVREPGMSDARLVGVLYLLGRSAESLGRADEAAAYFQRVLAVQIGFRDTAHRLSALAG
jgi:tetratricopeptide (TPR) repeat protein